MLRGIHNPEGDGVDSPCNSTHSFSRSGPGIARAERYEIIGGKRQARPNSIRAALESDATDLELVDGATIVRMRDRLVIATWRAKVVTSEGKHIGEWEMTSQGVATSKVA